MQLIKLQERHEIIPEASPLDELDLLSRNNLYFETRTANTPALINAAHALRFQVYCLERKFEKTEEHAGGMEVDAFDSHAIHGLLIYRPTDEALGTVRIILPENGVTHTPLPAIGLLRDCGIDLADYVPIERTVEISRFAISKQLRRRLVDQSNSPGIASLRSRIDRERQGNLPCLSLMQFVLRQTLAIGATHWAAVMEIKLLRMLASMGIQFQPIGPVVLHHGLRQPCYGDIAEMFKIIKRDHYEYWHVVTNAGELGADL